MLDSSPFTTGVMTGFPSLSSRGVMPPGIAARMKNIVHTGLLIDPNFRYVDLSLRIYFLKTLSALAHFDTIPASIKIHRLVGSGGFIDRVENLGHNICLIRRYEQVAFAEKRLDKNLMFKRYRRLSSRKAGDISVHLSARSSSCGCPATT